MAFDSPPERSLSPREMIHAREIRECITHDRPVAMGSNALIFKTKTSEEQGHAAVKVLKVYRAGAGEREFTTLRRAHEILSGDKSAAQVPQPQDFITLSLTQQERDHLNSFGAHLIEQQPVETFDMTFIEGKDFARIVYEEVIRRCSAQELLGFLREGENPSDLIEESASLEYLFDIVQHVLKLENPLRADAAGIPQNDLRTLWRNSKKIFDYLSSRGFMIHPAIVNQLQRSIDILHANGIHHNDLHERNIMIEGRIDSESGKVWMLDFGMSQDDATELQSYRDDYSLVRLLESCTKTKAERLVAERDAQLQLLAQEILTHSTNPVVYGIYLRYSKFGKENRIESVGRSLAASLKPTLDLAAIKLLCDNEIINFQDARRILEYALTQLVAKNIPATKSKSASIYNPALQSLLKLASDLWT